MNIMAILFRFLVFVLLLSACTSPTDAPTEIIPVASAAYSSPTPKPMVVTAAQPALTLTAKPGDAGIYPLSTRTGIADIDAVLAAVERGDPQSLRDLFHFTIVACTKQEGLGGPPKCVDNEAEGTLVEVLPFLGPEGSFLRKAEVSNFPGVDVTGLYAAYNISDAAYSEEAYPAGKYAVIFIGRENQSNIVIHIQDGIVRMDYLYPPTLPDDIIQRDAAQMILIPKL